MTVAACTAVGRKASRTGIADADTARGALNASEPRGRQKPLGLLAACNALRAQEAAWDAATQHCQPEPVSSRLDSNAQPSTESTMHDSTSSETQRRLREGAASAISDLKKQHLFEGTVLTSSMVAASEASEKANSRWPNSRSTSAKAHSAVEVDTSGSEAQPASFKKACAFMWAPLRTNRDSDQLFASRKWTQEELTSSDPRSPRR